MRRIVDIFIASAFGHAADGRYLFMPFGAYGTRYLIENREDLGRLRRQVGAFIPLAAVPFSILLSLLILPPSLRTSAFPWIIVSTIGSFALFVTAFMGWVQFITRPLKRLDQDVPSALVQFDPQEAAASEIVTYLITALEQGRQSGKNLTVVGALAGFACQMAVRAQAGAKQQPSGLAEVALADGRLLYFGDALNGPLAEAVPSVWSIVSDGMPAEDLHHIFRDTVEMLTAHQVAFAFAEPLSLLIRHWRTAASILSQHGIPADCWHLALARAAREIAYRSPPLPPKRAALAVMRAAVPMSKVDPAEVLVPEGASQNH